jgi:hypothetical protein
MASKKKSKKVKVSFRQRLRNDAAEQLYTLKRKFEDACEDVVIAESTGIEKRDVFRLLAGGQTKTLEERLVTELANEKEDALERMYNSQQDLSFGTKEDDHADKKEG